MAQPLAGTTVFVSVSGSGGDASRAVASRAAALGAKVQRTLTPSISHVILGGTVASEASRMRGRLSGMPAGVAVVDARWVEESSKLGFRALEKTYTVDLDAIAGAGGAGAGASSRAGASGLMFSAFPAQAALARTPASAGPGTSKKKQRLHDRMRPDPNNVVTFDLDNPLYSCSQRMAMTETEETAAALETLERLPPTASKSSRKRARFLVEGVGVHTTPATTKKARGTSVTPRSVAAATPRGVLGSAATAGATAGAAATPMPSLPGVADPSNSQEAARTLSLMPSSVDRERDTSAEENANPMASVSTPPVVADSDAEAQTPPPDCGAGIPKPQYRLASPMAMPLDNAKNIVVCTTGCASKELAAVEAAVRELRPRVTFLAQDASSSLAPTHVVVGAEGRRTLKVLAGIARGAFLLTPEWAIDSVKAGKWLDPVRARARTAPSSAPPDAVLTRPVPPPPAPTPRRCATRTPASLVLRALAPRDSRLTRIVSRIPCKGSRCASQRMCSGRRRS